MNQLSTRPVYITTTQSEPWLSSIILPPLPTLMLCLKVSCYRLVSHIIIRLSYTQPADFRHSSLALSPQ